jgi:hypothetical protein
MTENQKLHQEALLRVKSYKNSESLLLEILIRINKRKGFKELGYNSLHEYCTLGLNLSSDRAYSLSKITQTNAIAPEIPQLIKEEKIHLSNATHIARIITPENKEKWLEKAQTLSKRDLEREIKKEYPETIPKEKIRTLTDTLSEARLVLPKDLEEDLKKLQDIYSTNQKRPLSLVETIGIMRDECLRRRDPIAKAKRNLTNTKQNLGPGPKVLNAPVIESQSRQVLNASTNERSGRIRFPSQLVHHVTMRDQAQCTHLYSEGRRCIQKRWLNIHHIRPLSIGGTNDLDNLQTLCYGHHRFIHEKHNLNIASRIG